MWRDRVISRRVEKDDDRALQDRRASKCAPWSQPVAPLTQSLCRPEARVAILAADQILPADQVLAADQVVEGKPRFARRGRVC